MIGFLGFELTGPHYLGKAQFVEAQMKYETLIQFCGSPVGYGRSPRFVGVGWGGPQDFHENKEYGFSL